MLAIPITAVLAIEQKGSLRAVTLAGLALMIGALFLTYSRGGYLGLALAGTVFILGSREKIKLNRATLGVYVGATLVVLVLIVTLIAPARSAVARAWHRSETVGSDKSIGSRIDLWTVALRMIEDHPLVGTGPETFPDEFPGYSRTALSAAAVRHFDQFRVESPHSEVLAIASGAGIPAAVAYLSLLVGVIYVLWQATRRTSTPRCAALAAVIAAVLGHVVTNAFMTSEVTGSWLFWILVGASVGTASVVSADSEADTLRAPDGLHVPADTRRSVDESGGSGAMTETLR